jgi:hypothetical protein
MTNRLTTASLALALGFSLTVAGCGDDGDNGKIATAGGASASPTASAAAKLSDDERRLKFAECMRGQGIEMDDPGKGEGVRLRFGKGTSPEKAEAAMKACKEYAPNGGEPLKLNPEQAEQMREFAKCMRANGVPNFPDPDANGRIMLKNLGGGAGLDPDSEEFKAAGEKCRQLRPSLRPAR